MTANGKDPTHPPLWQVRKEQVLSDQTISVSAQELFPPCYLRCFQDEDTAPSFSLPSPAQLDFPGSSQPFDVVGLQEHMPFILLLKTLLCPKLLSPPFCLDNSLLSFHSQ